MRSSIPEHYGQDQVPAGSDRWEQLIAAGQIERNDAEYERGRAAAVAGERALGV